MKITKSELKELIKEAITEIKNYSNNKTKKYGVYFLDSDIDFNPSPLFYVWSEYPKHKKFHNGLLLYQYEFYVDNNKNKYLIADGTKTISDKEIKELIDDANWNLARNVDEFVNGADKEDYKRWLELIN